MNLQNIISTIGIAAIIFFLPIGVFIGGAILKILATHIGKINNVKYLKSCLVVFVSVIANMIAGYLLSKMMHIGNMWVVTFIYILVTIATLVFSCKYVYPCNTQQAVKTCIIPAVCMILAMAIVKILLWQ